MRILVAMFLFTGLAILPCQAQFNNYKYFIVPKRFDIFKDANQYQTSTLVKYLLSQYGYETLYDDAIPEELFLNKCLGVTAQLEEASTFLQTKVAVKFLDCTGREVYRTPEGTSKSKEFKEAYAESIKEALDVMAILKYEYAGTGMISPPPPAAPALPVVERVEESPDEPLAEKPSVASDSSPPVLSEDDTAAAGTALVTEPVYWSEAINQNGYVLNHPETGETWVLMRTSDASVYLAYSQNKQGIAFKQDTGWKLEYYLGDDRLELSIRTRDQ